MSIFHRLINLSTLIMFLVGCTTATSTTAPAIDELENRPTRTARPSFTPAPIITPSQTQVLFNQITYDATQSVVQTKVAQFPRVCTEDYSRPDYSPNDLWMEEMCYSEDDHGLVLTLSNRETQVLWKLLYQDYIPPMDFVPDGGMSVVHWSLDGKYAYFNSFLGGDGGECFVTGWDSGVGLFRLDLQTGNTTALLAPGKNYLWYGFSFSPTDRRLVYAVRGRDLKILDITTGQLIRVFSQGDFSEAGGYIWSQDGLRFVYSTVLSGVESVSYAVRLVDAQSGSERILLDSPDACFAAISWREDNILTLQKNYGEAVVEFDLNSNKIISESKVTP